MYRDIKINRYEIKGKVEDLRMAREDFDFIDNYKKSIEKYIYTDIKMTDFKEPLERAFQSRLQILLSSVLLRSLLLKEGLVTALNRNNFPSYYAILKSFIEVPALIGYLVHLVNENEDLNKIIQVMARLQLGTRKAGSFSIGKRKAINVLSMFKKLDKVVKNMEASGKSIEEREKIFRGENNLTSIYKNVCNFGHINWPAHISVGIMKEGIWGAKKKASWYKKGFYHDYMLGFVTGIAMVRMCCSMLVRNQKVKNFNLLSNKYYFET